MGGSHLPWCSAAAHHHVSNRSRTGHAPLTCPTNGTLWNIDPTADWPHSALMLRARMTLPHFSVSSAMSLPKSAGESASTSPPRSASRALILGSARPALISLLSLSTISVGVVLG